VVNKAKEVKMIMDGIKRRKIGRELKKVGESSNKEFIGRGRNKRKNPNYDPRMGTSKKQDFKKNPLKVGKMSTPNRKLAKDENKISRADMIKGMPDDAGNKRKKKARRNAAGTMGQMAYGGKVKKMMGGGMAMKYGHGGTVGKSKSKKCPRDGIAMRGRTRA
tara:strand:- start:26 stop:511 length:486 start_codon:yes stop_codon:yes gene_type:complete